MVLSNTDLNDNKNIKKSKSIYAKETKMSG